MIQKVVVTVGGVKEEKEVGEFGFSPFAYESQKTLRRIAEEILRSGTQTQKVEFLDTADSPDEVDVRHRFELVNGRVQRFKLYEDMSKVNFKAVWVWYRVIHVRTPKEYITHGFIVGVPEREEISPEYIDALSGVGFVGEFGTPWANETLERLDSNSEAMGATKYTFAHIGEYDDIPVYIYVPEPQEAKLLVGEERRKWAENVQTKILHI